MHVEKAPGICLETVDRDRPLPILAFRAARGLPTHEAMLDTAAIAAAVFAVGLLIGAGIAPCWPLGERR
jgi:hypothetical protein